MILVGSPTIGQGITNAIAGFLEEIEGLKFKNKKAAAFGCYGWSGESVTKISDWLNKAGFTIINEGIKCLWNPGESGKEFCRKFGKELLEK